MKIIKKMLYILLAIVVLCIGMFLFLLFSIDQKKEVGLLNDNYKIFVGGDTYYRTIAPKCRSFPKFVVNYNSEIAIFKHRFIVGKNPEKANDDEGWGYIPGYFWIDSMTDKTLSNLDKDALENILGNTALEKLNFLPAHKYINLNGPQTKAMHEQCQSDK